MTSHARRLLALLLRPGRAEAVGFAVGLCLFIAILRFAALADDGVSPPMLVASSLFSFIFIPRFARELVATLARRPQKTH